MSSDVTKCHLSCLLTSQYVVICHVFWRHNMSLVMSTDVTICCHLSCLLTSQYVTCHVYWRHNMSLVMSSDVTTCHFVTGSCSRMRLRSRIWMSLGARPADTSPLVITFNYFSLLQLNLFLIVCMYWFLLLQFFYILSALHNIIAHNTQSNQTPRNVDIHKPLLWL
jgi:hypothetical protein